MASDTHRINRPRLFAFCAAYVGLAFAGAKLYVGAGGAPAIWPPSGLFVALLLTSRLRFWPFLLVLGATLELVVRVWLFDGPLATGLFCALGVASGAAAGALATRGGHGSFQLHTLRDALAFYFGAAIVGPAVGGAICAAAGLALHQHAAPEFAARWASQAVGVLCFAPAALALPRGMWRRLDISSWVEAAAMLFVTTAIGRALFEGLFPFGYALLPILLWAAIRLEMVGAASFLIALSIITINLSTPGRGMLAAFDIAERQWFAQLFLMAMSLSALVVAAITFSRRQAMNALQKANLDLERRIDERTSALQQTEERLRMALDAARMEAFEFCPDAEKGHRVGDAMRRADAVDHQAVDRDFFSRLHPEDRATLEAAIAGATPTQPNYTVEYRFKAPDGEWRWITDRAKMVFDDKGARRRVFGVLIDNTEMKRAIDALRASETRFSSFMEHLPGLAWIKTAQGRYVYLNEAAERAFQKPRDELYGKTDAEIFPAATAAQFAAHDREALTSDAGLVALETLMHDDGVLHHSLVSKFPIRSGAGEFTGVGGVAIDITERVIAEQKLLEATEQLRLADRRKDEFLAMLAHELRNPLAPIRNGLNVLNLVGDHSERSARLRAMMERQLDHLVRLVDDLMEVARISSGKITLKKQRVDLVAILRDAIDMSKDAVDAAGLLLATTLPQEKIALCADPVRLTQIFANLINNAAKYTTAGGRVTIDARRVDGEAVIRVIDTGVGIAPEMLPRIFELFAQADRTLSHAKGGLGIGLALAKNLVELHGGTIAAESHGEGHGSCFTVRLPLDEGDPADTADAPKNAPVHLEAGRR